MNILSISISLARVEFGLFKKGSGAIAPCKKINGWMKFGDLGSVADKIAGEVSCGFGLLPDHACVRIPYGGREFGESNAPADDESFARLAKISHSAPLHIPHIIALCKELKRRFNGVSFSFAVETAFFSALPEREVNYAISDNAVPGMPFRRTGHHGLFHESAYRSIFEKRRYTASEKVVSVCLEPVPEIAAIVGTCPVMVTGGATPLEGLPGETTCGEIDPFIVLNLSKKFGWGPEQINNILTKKSGILGLTGKRMQLDRLLSRSSRKYDPAKKIFVYKLTQSCGAAAAAMGGADFIVFSGRYASAGRRYCRSASLVLRFWIVGVLLFRFFCCTLPTAKVRLSTPMRPFAS